MPTPRNPALAIFKALQSAGENEDTLDVASFFDAARELDKPGEKPTTCVVCAGPLGDEPGARCTECREAGRLPEIPKRPEGPE